MVTSSQVIRLLVWLGCLAGFLYQTSGIIEMYRAYPFTVTIIEEVRSNIMFPGITVCLESWVNTSALCEHYPTKCSLTTQKISPGVYYMQFDPEMRNKSMYSPKDIFRCTMRSTVTTCFSFNCLEVMRPTYFRPPGSQCYTVDAIQWSDEDHRFKKCTMPWTWELSLRAAWQPERSLRLVNTQKLPLVIHRSETIPPDRLSSITIKPGLSYTVSVAQQTVKRLPPPFASKCSRYRSLGKKAHFLGFLTQDLCVQECVVEDEQKTCDCIRSTHEFGGFFPYRTCSVEEIIKCDKHISNLTLPKCMKKCGPPCLETTYDVRLTSLGEDKVEKDRESFSVSVKFSSDSQKIFQYQPKLSLIEAFGYMGGYIGMWLGLSLFKLITDAERWIRKYLLQRAIQKAKERVIGINHHSNSSMRGESKQNDPHKFDSTSAKCRAVYSVSTAYGQVRKHDDYRDDATRFPTKVQRRF